MNKKQTQKVTLRTKAISKGSNYCTTDVTVKDKSVKQVWIDGHGKTIAIHYLYDGSVEITTYNLGNLIVHTSEDSKIKRTHY